jgi:HK97 family phage major capsid protein
MNEHNRAVGRAYALERKEASDLPAVLAEVKKIVTPLMTGFEEYKKTNDQRLKEIETKGKADPLTEEKLARIEATLSGFEGLNQKLVNAEALEAKRAEREKQMQEQLDRLQLKVQRPGMGSEEARIERKTYFNDWARGVIGAYTTGVPNLPEPQAKAIARATAEFKSLSVSNDTTGGYLAPAEYVADIIKGITLVSPVRSLVSVKPTANKSRMQPRRTGQFAAQWVAEQGARSETTGLAYGMVEIPTHEMFALIDISHQNLEDTAFDLEAEIRGEAEEQFAVAEGAAVVSGNAVGKPEGWLTNTDVASTNSGTAATIADANGQADGLLTLKYALKSGYARNAKWALNRTTMGSVRKLKDNNRQYIWMPGLAQGQPNTIDGDPYVEVPDMPNEGANTFPIAYGDFARAYTLVDRIAMSMLRDPYTQATSGNIRFLFYRRIGGQIVLAEAIRKLKCST